MPHTRHRPWRAVAAGGVAVAMLLGGAASASAADYDSDLRSFGTSRSDPWTVSDPDLVTLTADAGSTVLQLTAAEGRTSRILHYLSSGTFPTVDAAYEAKTTWGRFLDGTRDPGSTLPYAEPASADIRVSAGASLYLDLAMHYLTAEGDPAITIWECDLQAGESWTARVLSQCNYEDLDIFAYPYSNWVTTEPWTYRTSATEPGTASYAAGDRIRMTSTITSAYPVGIGFRVEGPAGSVAQVDDVVIRDSALSFSAVPTTLSLAATANGVATPGVRVALTGTVSPSTASGVIRFTDGGTTVAEGAVAGGRFSATAELSTVGRHTLTAAFLPADEGAYAGSTSTPVDITVNTRRATPAPPPAPSTEELLELEGARTVAPGDFVPSGGSAPNPDGSFSAGEPFSGEIPWPDAEDSFVDVYAYSSPVFLGTFPVVNGVVQLTGVDLSALSAGGHHLVFVGQTSGSVSVLAIEIAAELAATGVEPGLPWIAGGIALLLGVGLLAFRRVRVTASPR